jgi:hypothetical protein
MKFEAGLAATALGRMAAGRGDVELCRTYLDKLGLPKPVKKKENQKAFCRHLSLTIYPTILRTYS